MLPGENSRFDLGEERRRSHGGRWEYEEEKKKKGMTGTQRLKGKNRRAKDKAARRVVLKEEIRNRKLEKGG